MKKIVIIFLQIVIILLGISTLIAILWEPHIEGRNTNATLYQIYFNDPFLAYAYTASIAFFVALYQTFKLLGYIKQNKIFSKHSIKALQTIKYCATTLIIFIVGAEIYFFTIQRNKNEDIAGGVVIGLFMLFVFMIVATSTTALEKYFKKRYPTI